MQHKTQDFSYWASRPSKDKGDWLDEDGDWIANYWKSQDHPHRALIVDALRNAGDVKSILEAGSSCGPNLALIKNELSLQEKNLCGFDANADSVAYGLKKMPQATWLSGDIRTIALESGSYDAVLCDASLMYVAPNDIKATMINLSRIARHVFVIVDRYHESELGELTSGGHIWARNYEKLLAEQGFEVSKLKLRKEDWPTSERWSQDGWVWWGVKL